MGSRELRTRAPDLAEQSKAAAPRAAPTREAAALALQRSVGNAAATAILAREPAAPTLPSADLLTTSIVAAIGVYETNRSGSTPNVRESELETVAGVSASMATINQTTMPNALTALKKSEALRKMANPELTLKEILDAEKRCIDVATLLEAVKAAANAGTTPDDYIKANAAVIAPTGLGEDHVRTMFEAVGLEAKVAAARAQVKAGKQTAAEAAEAIPEGERVGVSVKSLMSYINKAWAWGEHKAAWQRIAVQQMPGDIAKRIEEVAESGGGTGLTVPVVRSNVDAQLAKKPQPSEEAIVKAVAQQNNPNEKGYGDKVWAIYQRLASEPPPVSGPSPRPVEGDY
jgi:hypothetical protein